MIETIRSIIQDYQEMPLETGVPRRLQIKVVPGKATVCIGVRRSGKSTYMFQTMQRLVDGGVPRENILYMNFFDDRLHALQHENIGWIAEAYYSIYPQKKNAETVYCFFDEIQAVSGWEPFVDRLMRTEKCEVYLTGSSARMLSKEIATQMRGRALSWEMFPFSFAEFLDYKGIDSEGAMSTKTRLLIQQCFEQYRETGGFPEVVCLEHRRVAPPVGRGDGYGDGYGYGNGRGHGRGDGPGYNSVSGRQLRIKIHQEYLRAILFRDLIERHDIAHPNALSDLAHWLVDNTASLYTLNGLTRYLKSLGHKVSKSVVSEYLEWFEDAFFLFTVRMYDASLSRSNANPKKVYCIDHALVTSLSSGILVNSGHLLENLVFTAIRRAHPMIYYFKSKTGREVDFVVPVRRGSKMLVQVCESLAKPQTRKREIETMSEAMTELGVTNGTIVTRNEGESVDVAGGTIEVVPAWRFLLDLSHSSE